MPGIDDITQSYIDAIDNAYSTKFGVSIAQFIKHPEQYIDNKEEILLKEENLKAYINEYFDKQIDSLKDEYEEFTKVMESISAQSDRIKKVIMDEASSKKIPFIEPNTINISENMREDIIIEKYDDTIDSLISKLIDSSIYIADTSVYYQKYNVGSWLFSTGSRSYVLRIFVPNNPILSINSSKSMILNLVDYAFSVLRRS